MSKKDIALDGSALTPAQRACIESLRAKATPEEWAAVDALCAMLIKVAERAGRMLGSVN